VFDSLDFLARLAALVPRPRAHLLTDHGVLASAAKWRELIVPRSPSSPAGAHAEQRHGPNSDTSRTANARQPKRATRSTSAELMLRAFAIDVLTCPDCGGERRLIAMITEVLVVRRILDHLDHLEPPSSPPVIAPARAPPEPEFAW